VVALLLIVLQPRLTPWLASRRTGAAGPAIIAGVFATGVYGGYFGAGQGVILIGVMGLLLAEPLQEINAIKNVLAGLVNAVAAFVFVLTADVAWGPVALLAAGSVLGGTAGGRVVRRLPPAALRALVIVVGLSALVLLLS
jgi:hypothetical protein